MAKEYGYGGVSTYQLMERVYFAQGDSASAEKLMREGIVAFPDQNEILLDVINYYIVSNKDAEAFEYVKIAKEKNPDDKLYWYVEGMLYDKTGQEDKAIVSYTKSIELDPAYYNPQYNMGVIMFNRGVKLVDEANKLTDNTEYTKAKKTADDAFTEAVPYFEKASENAADDMEKRESLENLKVLYYRLKMMDKREEVIKQLDEIGS